MSDTSRSASRNQWRNTDTGYSWCRVTMVLWLLLVTPTVVAQDLITERAVFEDNDAALNFQQVQTKTFTPFSDILSRGYGRSALWIRLRIQPESGEEYMPVILRVRPGYLDEVRLYDPQYQSMGTQVTGDSMPIAGDDYRSLNINLVIPQGDRTRDVWLRIVSSSTRLFEVQALNHRDVLQQDRVQEIPYGIFLAAIGVLALWGAVHWIMRPDRLMLLFTVKEAVALLFMLGYLGYARLLWPSAVTFIQAGQYTDGLLPIYSSVGCLFDYYVLRSFRAHPKGLRVLRGLAILFLVEYGLIGSGHPQQAFMLNGIGLLMVVSLTVLLAISTPDSSKLAPEERPPLSRRSLILLYTLIFLGFMASLLPLFGLTKASFLVFDGFLFHGLVSGLAMLVLMMRRGRENERRLSAAEAAREFAERRAEAEQRQRQEQAQFLTMLTHELKTPLAVVRMVLGSRAPTDQMKYEAERSIIDMHNIIQRCMQVEQLADPVDPDRLHACCIVDELTDLIHSFSQSSRIRLLTVDLPTVVTDTMLLRMIVANLIDNACKYGPEASPVTLRVTPKLSNNQTWICLRVENRPGKTGWPDPSQLFKKFYRSPRAQQYTGSGLGLFLSTQLAQQLGGQLRYRPTDTEIGFDLWIPA